MIFFKALAVIALCILLMRDWNGNIDLSQFWWTCILGLIVAMGILI